MIFGSVQLYPVQDRPVDRENAGQDHVERNRNDPVPSGVCVAVKERQVDEGSEYPNKVDSCDDVFAFLVAHGSVSFERVKGEICKGCVPSATTDIVVCFEGYSAPQKQHCEVCVRGSACRELPIPRCSGAIFSLNRVCSIDLSITLQTAQSCIALPKSDTADRASKQHSKKHFKHIHPSDVFCPFNLNGAELQEWRRCRAADRLDASPRG